MLPCYKILEFTTWYLDRDFDFNLKYWTGRSASEWTRKRFQKPPKSSGDCALSARVSVILNCWEFAWHQISCSEGFQSRSTHSWLPPKSPFFEMAARIQILAQCSSEWYEPTFQRSLCIFSKSSASRQDLRGSQRSFNALSCSVSYAWPLHWSADESSFRLSVLSIGKADRLRKWQNRRHISPSIGSLTSEFPLPSSRAFRNPLFQKPGSEIDVCSQILGGQWQCRMGNQFCYRRLIPHCSKPSWHGGTRNSFLHAPLKRVQPIKSDGLRIWEKSCFEMSITKPRPGSAASEKVTSGDGLESPRNE